MNYFDRTLIAGERDESTQIVRHYPMCHGPCNQGRNQCPTPEACEVPDDSDPEDSALFWRAYAAVLLVAMAGFVAWLLPH